MKMKRFAAVVLTAALCALCVPFSAGCSAKTVYTLKTDEDGNRYYELSFSGYGNALSGELVIPETYGEGEDAAPVEAIAPQGLAGTRLTRILVPNTIREIGTAAFSYNYSLTEVVFAEDSALEEIPQGAFAYCQALSRATLPDGIKRIGAMAFYSCNSLSEAALPDTLETIGTEAFCGCTALQQILLPQRLTTIGTMAFYNAGLTSVVIPDSVRDTVTPVLGEDGAPSLDEDGNPVTATTFGLGYAAFHSCLSLKTAVVGSGITVLRSGVFGYCTALEEIYLPAELLEVEGAYFVDGAVYYGHPFHSDAALTDVYFAGTSEQWEQLKKNTDETSSSDYDNSAFLNASAHCGVTFGQ